MKYSAKPSATALLNMTAVRTGAILMASLLLVPQAFADTIILKDGSKQRGLIVKGGQPGQGVSLQSVNGKILYPQNRIQEVIPDPPAVSHEILGDQLMEAKRYKEAAAEYQMSVDVDRANPKWQQKLKTAQDALGAIAAAEMRAGDAKVDAAIAASLTLMNTKKFAQAYTTLKDVEPDPTSPAFPNYKKALADLYYLWGVHLNDSQDKSGAVEKLQLALQLNPTNEQATAALIASFEGDPTKLKQQAEYYGKSENPDDQLKAADAFFKMREYERSLQIYLKLAQDPERASDTVKERIRSIYRTSHELFAQQGDYVRAMETYQALLTADPQADPAPLARYQYMIKRAATDMADPNSRAELAKFAEDWGLISTAKQEYANILAIAPTNAAALEGMKRYAINDLNDAKNYFSMQQYSLVVQKATEVMKEHARFEDVVKEAQALLTKSQVEAQKMQADKAKQAVALALRGDDYYNQAMSYFSSYVSTNVKESARVFSAREEAAKYFRQAIYAWQVALELDPRMGDATTYNLRFKIADANQKYVVMANRNPPRLPLRDLNRSSRGQNVPGSK